MNDLILGVRSMIWNTGSPEDHINPHKNTTYHLLEFDFGTRFVVAKYWVNAYLKVELINVETGGRITDRPIRYLYIPSPE